MNKIPKIILSSLIVILSSLILVLPSWAIDVSGEWDTSSGDTGSTLLTLEQTGNNVKGNYAARYGGEVRASYSNFYDISANPTASSIVKSG